MDDLSLFNFHETEATEKTHRLITNIIPISNIYPQLFKNNLLARTDNLLTEKDRELAFLQDGIRSVADTPEKLLAVTNTLA
ncbi:MAG: hypothetical protein LBH73_08020, partial [Spirochaetaceae bacterium]|nr:hypothetical protein [Spirochaetaceae bacterium]